MRLRSRLLINRRVSVAFAVVSSSLTEQSITEKPEKQASKSSVGDFFTS